MCVNGFLADRTVSMASSGCAHRVVIIVYMADRPALPKNCWQLRESWERVLQSTGHQRKNLRRGGLRRGGRISGGFEELRKVARTFRLQIPFHQRLAAPRHSALEQVSVDLNVRLRLKSSRVCVCVSVCPRAPRRPETQEDQVQQKPTQGSYRGL